MTLYLPIGVPGAGKTTLRDWSLLHGVIEADAVLCPDEYRVILTGDRADQTANKSVFEIVDLVISNRLSRDLDVWLDATNLNTTDRNKLHHKAKLFGQKVTAIFFNVDLEEIQRRNAVREHPVPEFVLSRMVARWHLVRQDYLGGSIQCDLLCDDQTFRSIAAVKQ